MAGNLEFLNAHVPTMPRISEEDSICLEGVLLRGSSDRVRLVCGNICFELDLADIIFAEEVVAEDGEGDQLGIYVVLLLKKGARLVDMFPAESLIDFWAGRRPFSLSARSGNREFYSSPKFRALERSFLERHHQV
jgi:hypothetical protein